MRLRPYRAEGIAFVSFSKQLDTSTPAREMVFTVLGVVAKLARGLIVERAKDGLRDTRAKGKRLGRPKAILDTKRIAYVPLQECRLEADRRRHGVGVGTLCSVALHGSKTREKVLNPEVGRSRLSRCPVA